MQILPLAKVRDLVPHYYRLGENIVRIALLLVHNLLPHPKPFVIVKLNPFDSFLFSHLWQPRAAEVNFAALTIVLL